MSNNRLNRVLQPGANRRIAFWISCAVAVCVIPSLTFDYLAAREERIAAESMIASTPEVDSELQTGMDTLAETQQELSELQQLMIGEEDITDFRTVIADLVRASECRLRNIIIDEVSERPWLVDDSVFRSEYGLPDDEFSGTDYVLQSRPVRLEVTGEFSNLSKLMASIRSVGALKHTHSMKIGREIDDELRLNWEIHLFNLQHVPRDEDFDS